MAKIRNVSGEDRVLADGRLVPADAVVDVAESDSYTCQGATWEAVETKGKES